MKRKTWLTIPLLLTLVALSQSLTTPSSAVDFPGIYITPSSIINTGLTPTTNFTISIETDYNGSDIWGWQLTLTYNPLVLEGYEVVNGNLTISDTAPATFRAGTFDNSAGKLFNGTGGYFDVNPTATPPTNVTSGPGILANVTFRVVGTGDTPITLGIETKLIGYDGDDFYDIVEAELKPDNIGHGYFRNTAFDVVHDAAVLVGTGTVNDTKPYYGRVVFFNVTVKNEGNVSERFDVSIYYRVISLNWRVCNQTVTLASGANQTISFVWSTLDWPRQSFKLTGTGNLTVVATEVWNETDTADNQLVIDEVHIRIEGDITADGTVDSLDLNNLAGTYPDKPASANPDADLNNDGIIDSTDWMRLVGRMGLSEPEISY